MMSNCQRFNENISTFSEINGKFLVTILKQVKAVNSASGQPRPPQRNNSTSLCRRSTKWQKSGGGALGGGEEEEAAGQNKRPGTAVFPRLTS